MGEDVLHKKYLQGAAYRFPEIIFSLSFEKLFAEMAKAFSRPFFFIFDSISKQFLPFPYHTANKELPESRLQDMLTLEIR